MHWVEVQDGYPPIFIGFLGAEEIEGAFYNKGIGEFATF
jgi:hypothetical protein